MKSIGDVLSSLSISVGPAGNGGSAEAEPVWRCPVCKDAGWVRMEVPVGHPNFGRLFPCQCKISEQDARGREHVRRLSNLDGFTQHTFAEF
jgi:DNA replication protein DnaC